MQEVNLSRSGSSKQPILHSIFRMRACTIAERPCRRANNCSAVLFWIVYVSLNSYCCGIS